LDDPDRYTFRPVLKNSGITQDKTLRRYMGIDKDMEKEAMKKAFDKI